MRRRILRKTLRQGWIQSAGFIFAACTVVPILIGWHVGSYYEREVTGAMVGLGWGLVLGILIVVRPLWLEAGRADESEKDDT